MPVIQVYITLLKELMNTLSSTKQKNVSNAVPGFTTSQKTRPLIVAKLERVHTQRTNYYKICKILSGVKNFCLEKRKTRGTKKL